MKLGSSTGYLGKPKAVQMVVRENIFDTRPTVLENRGRFSSVYDFIILVSQLISGSLDGKILIWNIKTKDQLLEVHEG